MIRWWIEKGGIEITEGKVKVRGGGEINIILREIRELREEGREREERW